MVSARLPVAEPWSTELALCMQEVRPAARCGPRIAVWRARRRRGRPSSRRSWRCSRRATRSRRCRASRRAPGCRCARSSSTSPTARRSTPPPPSVSRRASRRLTRAARSRGAAGESRAAALAAQRARVFELIAPVRRAALLMAPFSPVIATRLAAGAPASAPRSPRCSRPSCARSRPRRSAGRGPRRWRRCAGSRAGKCCASTRG